MNYLLLVTIMKQRRCRFKEHQHNTTTAPPPKKRFLEIHEHSMRKYVHTKVIYGQTLPPPQKFYIFCGQKRLWYICLFEFISYSYVYLLLKTNQPTTNITSQLSLLLIPSISSYLLLAQRL